MKMVKRFTLHFAVLLIISHVAVAQTATTTQAKTKIAGEMKTYVIEREIPDAAKLSAEQLKAISQKSCAVLKEIGSGIQWIQSYVTGNKLYCIYKAENEELIRIHAKKGGFPANNITQVSSVISPATAN